MEVNGEKKDFLVDTGATVSTLSSTPSTTLSKDTTTVMGFSGEPQTLPYTKPLHTKIGRQTLSHQYVYSPTVPVNLLGRDLLTELGATILCGPDGLTVTLPDGTVLHCRDHYGAGNYVVLQDTAPYLMKNMSEQLVNMYWGLLNPETPDHGGVLSAFMLWKPWITSLEPYIPPPDPPHVTLFYDRNDDVMYQEQFRDNVEGATWSLEGGYLYVAPEGVAAAIHLTVDQLHWYKMYEDANPHVSLALHPGHQAKELGSIVKRAAAAGDVI